jgi:hypothetical protein
MAHILEHLIFHAPECVPYKQQPSTRVESEGGFALFMHDFYFFYLSRPETGNP